MQSTLMPSVPELIQRRRSRIRYHLNKAAKTASPTRRSDEIRKAETLVPYYNHLVRRNHTILASR